MRVGIIGLLHESNTFMPSKTTLDDFRRIAAQVLTGLEYLHEEKVVHCDVKPQNVMVAENGKVKITDYGIALQP